MKLLKQPETQIKNLPSPLAMSAVTPHAHTLDSDLSGSFHGQVSANQSYAFPTESRHLGREHIPQVLLVLNSRPVPLHVYVCYI